MLSFAIAENSRMNEIYRLRYEVYCLERKYLPDSYPDQMEKDEYDESSVSFYAEHEGKLVGCFRIIEKKEDSLLPIEKHFSLFMKPKNDAKVIEASRLIAKRDPKIKNSEVMMGIVRMVGRYFFKNNIDYCYAAIEPCLHRLLGRIGFPFGVIGEAAFYMGARILPVILPVKIFEKNLKERNACLYRLLHEIKELDFI